jgi:hypothetical protein
LTWLDAARRLGLILVTQAAPLSVTELLSDPDRFNGQPVTVTGTICSFGDHLLPYQVMHVWGDDAPVTLDRYNGREGARRCSP